MFGRSNRVLFCLLFTASVATIGSVHAKGCGASEPARQPLLETIRDNADLVTFYMLLKKAGLENTLKSGASYTIFAPTDDAFRKVPSAKMVEIEKDKTKLRGLLMYHMTTGRYFRTSLPSMKSMTAVSGHTINLRGKSDSDLMVNEARLTRSSTPASNGAVHLIDAVMWPEGDLGNIPAAQPPASVTDVLKKKGNFKTLLEALEKSGLSPQLREGSFTLFAPTDEAFAKHPDLLKNKDELEKILSYHISSRSKAEVKDVAGIILQMSTIYGKPVYFKNVGCVTVNDAQVVSPDMAAGDGVIHGIDRLLFPKDYDFRSASSRKN